VRLYSYGAIETGSAGNGYKGYGFGIFRTSGDVLVVSSGAITTHGAEAHGMNLRGNYGDVSLDSGTAITTYAAGASGIRVYAAYEQSVSVTHSGAINTSGLYAQGIHVLGSYWAYSAAGTPVAIQTSAGSTIVTSDYGSHGISLDNSPYGYDSAVIQQVSLNIAGTIDAQGNHADGIYVRNALGPVDIDISGSVSGGAGIGSAIRILGNTAVSLHNTGTIEGAVITGEGDDEFTNGGLLLTGHVDFGGGSDVFINAGTIELAGAVNDILNLESFTNRGIIDLANDSGGDTLSISGAFTADGGALHLDADLASGTADLMMLDSVATTGNPTLVHVTDIGSGAAASGPIVIIDAQGDASDGAAFIGAPFGTHQYELIYDASASTWSLGPLGIYPGTAEYPALVSGALLGFASDLSSLHERIADIQEQGDDTPAIEPAAWNEASSRKLRPWLLLVQSKQDVDAGPDFDLAVTKLQAGFDTSRGEEGFLYSIGAFTAVGGSSQEFSASSTEMEADMLSLGAYGALRRGAFFADAIARYERQWAGLRSVATAQDETPFSVDLLGLSAETGYRFSHEWTYLQPRARLSYSHAWAGEFDDASGATIDLENAASLVGEVAARLGVHHAVEAGLYVDLALRHEFLGETSAQVSGLTFTHQLPDTSARLATGLAMHLLDGKLALFLDAAYARAEDAKEVSATGGLRFNY
jgi:fibronectin-binding autotransporter adhesin